MENQCWFYCYPEKFLTDTLHLSTHDVGAYLLGLMWYYANGPLPNDDQMLQRILRVNTADWQRCKGQIFQPPFFILNGDGHYHQKRADIEIKRRNDIIERNRAKTLAARTAKASLYVSTPVTGSLTSSERVQYGKEYERVVKQMEEIAHTYAGHQTWRREDKERFGKLKARREELRKILGIKV